MNTKFKNLKHQDENNQKEIRKLNQRLTDLNNENKSLVLQIEEMKRLDKDKVESIENINKNLNCNHIF